MKYLNDDMDELFARAGENYPLNLNHSDWDTIAARLENQTGTIRKKDKKRFIVISLILLAAGLLTSLYTQLYITKSKGLANNQLIITPGDPINTTIPIITNTGTGNYRINDVLYPQSYTRTAINGLIDQQRIDNYENNMTIVPVKKKIQLSRITYTPVDLSINKQFQLISHPYPIKLPIETGGNSRSKKGWYAGLAVGPQINEVKSQRMSKLSAGAGIIGGYRFSDRLSVESGIFFTRKHYYSEGKYFHMKVSDPSMPSNMEIISLESSSSIFEVPFKIKYDFISKRRAVFFSSAGLSSYIMTKEKNNYQAMINGSQEEMTGNYKSTNRYIAAAINLSAGYEYKLRTRTALRIEPFVQVPIRGIGVGSMPVTTAGLHIGIMWNLP